MDIKIMHEMKEKLAECAKHELDKGIESLDTKEFGEVVDMLKDLSEAEYYATITMEMKKAENEYGEDYDFMGPYEKERRGYRGQPRNSRGQYMSKRGYEEPMYMMTPEMYREHEPEWYRDMDRMSYGRMYYSGSGSSGGSSGGNMSGSQGSSGSRGYSGESGGSQSGSSSRNYGGERGYESNSQSGSMSNQRDYREGRSGQSRRSYMESKEMGKDKGEKMKELEKYMKELSEDVTEMIADMSPEEKTMLKNKMQVLTQKL